MTWTEELAAIVAQAEGDVALVVALAALRKVENGPPGREYGVKTIPAPTYADQLRIACQSLQHRVREYETETGTDSRHPVTGLFTDACLRFFSSKYAPTNATDDPNGLNRNHAPNLIWLAGSYGKQALEALLALK